MSKRMLEKLALPSVKEELPRLHASHAQLLPEEAETEYLKVPRLLMHPPTHKDKDSRCPLAISSPCSVLN